MLKYGVLAAAFVVASTAPALAYIDPVTGSVLVQALIGGVAAAMIAIRRVRERLFGLFRKRPSSDQDQEEQAPKS